MLRVTVTDASTGEMVNGCRVGFMTGKGAKNGWIFPIGGVTHTANGIVSAWWTAGSADRQKVVACIDKEGGARETFEITGNAGGERVLAGSGVQLQDVGRIVDVLGRRRRDRKVEPARVSHDFQRRR